jgi:hypothetical protein
VDEFVSEILEMVVDGDIAPSRKGGVTMYPASALDRIFLWADRLGHQIEWIEGVFYDPVTNAGQLSVAYICELRGRDQDTFRTQCLDTVAEMAKERRHDSLVPFVEIGISIDTRSVPLP